MVFPEFLSGFVQVQTSSSQPNDMNSEMNSAGLGGFCFVQDSQASNESLLSLCHCWKKNSGS